MHFAQAQCTLWLEQSSFESNPCCHLFPGNKPTECGIPSAEPLSLYLSKHMVLPIPSVIPEEINVRVSLAVWLWLPTGLERVHTELMNVWQWKWFAVGSESYDFTLVWNTTRNRAESEPITEIRVEICCYLLPRQFSCFKLDCKMSSVIIMCLADVSQ